MRSGGASVGLEAACVTLAKGSYKRNAARDGIRMTAHERQLHQEREVKKELCNSVVKLSADAGQLGKAERWIMKLDGSNLCNPEVSSFNALISAATKIGDIAKAEQWFAKVAEINLHPELHGLQPNLQSYNIMITACAEDGDIARAEKYVVESEAMCGSRPSLLSLCAVIRACVKKGEPRRSHRWLEALVDQGCNSCKNYAPRVVKAERETLRSLRRWDVDAYIALVIELIQALARFGNSITANQWLRYLSESGLKYHEAPEAWECVRAVHPQEIVPTVLSGEMESLRMPQSPALTRPATLNGERRAELKLQAIEPSGKPYQDRPLSQASTRPGTSIGNTGHFSQLSAWSAFGRSETPRSAVASRAASPALRKLLDARSRGATPTISRLGHTGASEERGTERRKGEDDAGASAPLSTTGRVSFSGDVGGR